LTKQEPKEGEPKGVVYLGAELGDWDGFPINLVMEEQGIPQVLPIFIDFRICLLVDVGCHTKQNHISAEVPDFGIFRDQRRCPDFRVFHIQML